MSAPVVCNSGPLIALGGIDRLDLLRHLFGRVIAPAEVFGEWQAGLRGRVGTEALERANWIEHAELGASPEPLLASLLDAGEAAVIALARQSGAPLVLLDEAKGRRIARDVYGLRVVGTGRVLVEAKRAGLVAEVKPLITAMRANGSDPCLRMLTRPGTSWAACPTATDPAAPTSGNGPYLNAISA